MSDENVMSPLKKITVPLVLGFVVVVFFIVMAAEDEALKKRPNILFIMVDDLGWKDLQVQGGNFRTPHIDKLAKEGMRFTDAYAASPVCTPTRAAAMTGLSPARLQITQHGADQWSFYQGKSMGPGHSQHVLGLEHETIAEIMKSNGYATGFFGKWHLSGTHDKKDEKEKGSPFYPDKQGFDVNKGGCGWGGPWGKNSFFDPYDMPSLEPRKEGEYLPYRLADEVISFMREQQQKDKAFFICLWNYTVHWPIEAPEELYKNYANKNWTLSQKYQAMVEGLDIATGKVIKALDDMKLSEETLVIFTSDNGPYNDDRNSITTTAPLRANKGHLYEGGIRVPLIVRWPGKVKVGESATPVVTMDFIPTFLDVASIAHDASIFDGESLWPLLTRHQKLSRESVFFHYPHYAFHRLNRMGSAIRQGDYKLLKFHDETPTIELYHLKDDIGESQNLADVKEYQELKDRLEKELDQWLEDTQAQLPRSFDQIPENSLKGKRTP